jgi:protease I
MSALQGKKVLMFIDHDFEDLETWYPVLRMREEGIEVHIAAPQSGETYIGKYGVPIVADRAYTDCASSAYDALYITGGWAPDKMRRVPHVLQVTREMHEAGKPIGHICHGGWVLISANICRGYTMTSTPGIKDDLVNAGATWVDQEVVVDRNIVSGRRPPDLPPFTKAFIDLIAQKV